MDRGISTSGHPNGATQQIVLMEKPLTHIRKPDIIGKVFTGETYCGSNSESISFDHAVGALDPGSSMGKHCASLRICSACRDYFLKDN